MTPAAEAALVARAIAEGGGPVALAGGGLVALGALLHMRRCLALIAQATHEVRGPLCAARLGLHGLGAGDGGARVAAIDLELRRAALALDDLAAARRGRRVRERRARVDVAGLVREAGPAWRALAAERGVELRVDAPVEPLIVDADRLRLAQACGNLVANALEHGGGAVHVRARESGGHARVEVTDDGPGLPAPVGELVAAARGRRTRRGHGLALAAGIAERHGGRLAGAPSSRGARIVLELPSAERADRPRRRRRRRWARAPREPAAAGEPITAP